MQIIRFTGFADHGVSEALYLNDPDENGVELYWDKPHEQWPVDEDGNINMYTKELDIDSLLAELTSPQPLSTGGEGI